jgi:hypothetical protein
MDPNVIGTEGKDQFDGKYASTIRDDLLAIPTISLTMARDDWFGVNGLFDNAQERGGDWERHVSVELRFDSQDLLAVFQSGEYRDDLHRNSTWSEGDWNCDGDFDSNDLVAAFQSGRFQIV